MRYIHIDFEAILNNPFGVETVNGLVKRAVKLYEKEHRVVVMRDSEISELSEAMDLELVNGYFKLPTGEDEQVSAWYCAELDIYLVRATVYNRRKLHYKGLIANYYVRKGNLLQAESYVELKPKALLTMCGYSTEKESELSDMARQRIMKQMVVNGLVGVYKLLEIIDRAAALRNVVGEKSIKDARYIRDVLVNRYVGRNSQIKVGMRKVIDQTA